MKIAILSPRKYEEAETFIRNHIDNLPFEKVVIYGGSLPYLSKNHIPTFFQKGRFWVKNYIRKKLGLKLESYHEHCLRKILINEKIDAVFSEYLITGGNAVTVCEKLKIPLHTIALGYEISIYEVMNANKRKYKQLFNYANSIFVVSQHMKKNLLKLGCPSNKIIFTPAGPKKDFFKISPSFNSLQVLAIGRFVDKKAPHLTILAFDKVIEEIPNAKLVMAGDGQLLSACKDLVIALKLKEFVEFIGIITPEKHRELLANSRLFVQHSKIAENGDSEGTPVAILEASAAGLPIVSTVHAGIPNVVINGETGYLVNENDVDQMANKIIELLKDKNKAILFGRKGKEFVENNFSLENHINTLSLNIGKEAI